MNAMASVDQENSDFHEESDEFVHGVEEISVNLREAGGIWDDDFITRQLRDWEQHELKIAVLGRTDSGKSSFINVIRGLKDTDEGAADVEVVECTHIAVPYSHPDNHKLVFWDLPGVGTLSHTKENFFHQVNINMFDFFLIFSQDGFTEYEIWLSEYIRKAKKKFFFVRSRVDIAIKHDAKDFPDKHKPEDVLENIRRDCEQQIKTTGETPCENVFLVSNKHPHKYEFKDLVEKLTEEFPSLKRDALILSLSAFDSPHLLKQKRELCRKRAYEKAQFSAVTALVPVPGIGACVDMILIVKEMGFYRKQFRVDDEAIKERAASLNINVDMLKSRYDLRSAIPPTVKTLSSIATVATVSSEVLENLAKICIPVAGSVFASGTSYKATLSILLKLIDRTYEDAEKLGDVMAKRSGFEIEYQRPEVQLPIDRSFIKTVAVLGEVKTGKSSLVNALRGVKATEPVAAGVGFQQTTTKRKCYNFTDEQGKLYELWDLPGTLKDQCPRTEYLKSTNGDSYDIYIICSSPSFTETDMWLAKGIIELNRPMLFVRTKLQDDIDNVSGGDSSTSNVIKPTLSKIRENYTTPLEKAGLDDTRVFIVETAYPSKFDFPKLRHYLRHCVETCEKHKTSCVVA